MTSVGRPTTLPRDRKPVAAGPAPVGPRRPSPRRLRRTPGRLTATLAVLVTFGLVTGVVAMAGVRQRSGLIDGVTARSGQLSVAAQNLYRSLSDADATAASAFLSNGLEPVTLRQRYQSDIADATAALAVVSAGAGEGRAATAVARITGQLAVYTGLVETARAYNRQGVPLGVAYLREASGLMRGELLPAAQELYRSVTDELHNARDAAGAFPWFALLLGLATLAGLVQAQIYLTRRTNRLFNMGLLVASAAAVLLVGWLGLSAFSAAGHLGASRVDGSAQVNLLAEARIASLQARADEALTLVARGNGKTFEEDYLLVMERLAGADGAGGLLAEARAAATDDPTRMAVDSAAGRAREWITAHRELRTLDDNGAYSEAVAAAVGSKPETTGSIFNQLDADLARAIAHNSERFEDAVERADRALSGVELGVAGLTILLVIGAALGIQRRIVEYR